MRLSVVAALLALAACSQDPKSNFPNPAALYDIRGTDLWCNGASSVEASPDTAPVDVLCWWKCIVVDGTHTRSVMLHFSRPDAAAAWRLSFASWELGVCDPTID